MTRFIVIFTQRNIYLIYELHSINRQLCFNDKGGL